MTVAIIDYGSGNLRSVAKAFEHVAQTKKVHITSVPQTLEGASHIVLPGVGAYGDCMRGLKAVSGMIPALCEQVLVRKKAFLGICVGMQMLFERGHEHGVHQGLGWLKGEVMPIECNPPLKVPHMGWNELIIKTSHPIFSAVSNGDHAYFVHSYHARCGNTSNPLATVDYGQSLAAVVGQGNIMGTQFHPEKSQAVGLQLLKNFLGL